VKSGGLAWFLLGAILGAVVVFYYDHQSTITTVLANKDTIAAGATLVSDIQTIYSSVANKQ
jgi:hypothetical protein